MRTLTSNAGLPDKFYQKNKTNKKLGQKGPNQKIVDFCFKITYLLEKSDKNLRLFKLC